MGFIIPAMIFTVAIGLFGLQKFKESKEPKLMVKSSLLFAHLTNGNDILAVDRGAINGMHYAMYATVASRNNMQQGVAASGAILYVLELPFNTQGHLVGISNKYHSTKSSSIDFVKQSGLTEVNLEGDFNNYFKLYSPEGQKIQARYIFDPAAMQYVVDFCSEFNWEIVYDELIFTASHGQSGQGLAKNSTEFINQIKPALIKEFTSKEAIKRKTPYGEWRGNPMPCPICQVPMEYKVNWHECPSGHGRLLHAQKLLGFRRGKLKNTPNIENTEIIERQTALVCPHCSNKMIEMQYAKRGLMIDSCPKCPYRWLDAGELVRILPRV